ncbi:AI-2E family transporter [Rhodocytophaga rosea]|uniref:AI-2E family transporter n=1 Tax=Rhodocytophaga rosea TaxID=2704465 RepID=A0A6C0GBG8_9BACT|nr:AI-2E family transporter [Rhodocytophaga rosea]QHT65286.1 AI-2E family transporter [Rhodocytophaga rosea]
MTAKENKISLPLTIASVLLIITLLVYGMMAMRAVLIPLAFSILLAIILYPLCRRLEKWKIGRIWAIIICLIVATVLVGGVITFISMQIMAFSNDLPQLIGRANQLLEIVQVWVEQTFNVKQSNQIPLLKNSLTEWAKTHGALFASTISATTSTLGSLLLLPVFIFFFLLYRNFFTHFFHKVFNNTPVASINTLLKKVQKVVQSYVLGLGLVILIIAGLNILGLLLLGIEYAIFFGLLGALLTIIPYVGIFIGSLLPILMSLLTKDSVWYAVGVAGVFFLVQVLEGNFITPNVVGSKVSVNPLAAIVGLILGGMLWGAAGMILALPFIAVLKVIFDSVESLEPYGYLLGESVEVTTQNKDLTENLSGRIQAAIKKQSNSKLKN